MPHLTIKNSFKIKGLEFLWQAWQVLASVLARKNCLKSMRCRKWHAWHGKNGVAGKKHARKEKRECKWNVNKPCGNVNQKVEKSAKRHDKRQFTHRHMQSHYYIYIYIIFYINYYRVTFFRSLFAVFRAGSCYFVLLHVNCFANVAALCGHGEVMSGTLTNITGLFLVFFKCKQIRTIYDFLTHMINSVK